MRIVVVIAALCAAPTLAAAQTIAVESHAGARPDDAGDLYQPVVQALADKGVTGGAELARRIADELSVPSATNHGDAIAQASTIVDNASRLAARGAHAEVVRLLAGTIGVYQAEPAAVASDPATRQRAFTAHALLATAQLEVGNADEAAALVDVMVTSFPDMKVEGALAALHAEASARLAKRPAGKLALSCSETGAELYVNERKVGAGSVTVDLPAGEYRVLARVGDRVGRIYRATVAGGATATVAIDWRVEGALRTDGAFVGLVFADDDARTARERETAVALATAIAARSVVVLGLRERNGERAMVATALDASTGKLLLAASIPIAPLASFEARARALADYLAGGPAAEGVEPLGQVAGSGKTELPPTPPVETTSHAHIYYWTGAGIGAAVLATGIYFVIIDGNGTCSLQLGQTQCPEIYDTQTTGLLLAGGGAVLAAAGTYFALRAGKKHSSERRAITVAPTRGGLAIGYTGRF